MEEIKFIVLLNGEVIGSLWNFGGLNIIAEIGSWICI